ncbi:excinuclease ABC subunit UvrC, partial [Polaromonas sp.]|nr:excinuclease ABC subunit UvrC [Candidatus Saccharibacteria bacterium]
KREEQIVIQKGRSNVNLNIEALHKLNGFMTETDDFILLNVPHNTNVIKLLQRIRDESHRFAVSYHSTLKQKRQTASLLEEIPGIGPATKKKLLRTFGSVKGVIEAPESDIANAIGKAKADIICRYLHEKLTPKQ